MMKPLMPLLGLLILGATACTPIIKIEVPDKPIVLKIDINIKQEILLMVERDIDQVSIAPAIPMAKKAGWFGERRNGYLGLVRMDAPQDIRDLMLNANEERASGYGMIAKKHKTDVKAVETVAGMRFIARSASGEFVEGANAEWSKK